MADTTGSTGSADIRGAEEITETAEKPFTASIKIADEVITGIVELAVSDINQVAGIAGGTGSGGMMQRFGQKASGKGIKAWVTDDDVKIDLTIDVEYGCDIPELSKAVQNKVKTMLENMTGFNVSSVNITVAGIRHPES